MYLGTLCRAMARQAELGIATIVRADEEAKISSPALPFSWRGHARFPERPAGLRRSRHQLDMAWRWGVWGMPLLAAKHRSAEFRRVVLRALGEFRPDAVLVEMAQMAQYLPLLGNVVSILTDHEGGVSSNATELGAWADRRDARLWRSYVRRYYPTASLLQAVTAEDANALAATLGRPVTTRPAVIDVPKRPCSPHSSPPRALFLGDYSHFPNREAAETLVRDVLPRLRAQVPETELWLAGPNAQRLNGIGHAPGVKVVGYVAALPSLFAQVRFLLAPLYSGSGFRMKAITALAHGLPVVTNPLGAQGCAAPTPACTIGADAPGLVHASLELLQHPARAGAAGTEAHRWALRTLTPDAVATTQLDRISALLPI